VAADRVVVGGRGVEQQLEGRVEARREAGGLLGEWRLGDVREHRLQRREHHATELGRVDGGRRRLGASEQQLDERRDDHRLLLQCLRHEGLELAAHLEVRVVSEELHPGSRPEEGLAHEGVVFLDARHQA